MHCKHRRQFRLRGRRNRSLRFANAEMLQRSAQPAAPLSAGLTQRRLYRLAFCGVVVSADLSQDEILAALVRHTKPLVRNRSNSGGFKMLWRRLSVLSPQILRLNRNKKNQPPKLFISFTERKETRPNSPFAGNSAVFNEVGCGTDGARQTHPSS